MLLKMPRNTSDLMREKLDLIHSLFLVRLSCSHPYLQPIAAGEDQCYQDRNAQRQEGDDNKR
jgi:hypothetical protein